MAAMWSVSMASKLICMTAVWFGMRAGADGLNKRLGFGKQLADVFQ